MYCARIVRIFAVLLSFLWYACVGFNQKCFKCLNSQNISLGNDQICDGKFDCRDFSDEFLCPDKRLKYDSRLQYALASLNAGVDLLNQDSAVELVQRMCIPSCVVPSHVKSCEYCSPGEFVCSPLNKVHLSSICVTKAMICDGVIHCPNGEDENFCGQGMRPSEQQIQFINARGNSNETARLNTTRLEKKNKTVSNESEPEAFAEEIQILANTKISCDVLDSLTPPFKRRGLPHQRRVSRRTSKAAREESILVQSILGNSPNLSVLFNWVSHSRRGEPAPLQKLMSRYLHNNEHNTPQSILFDPEFEVPEGIEVVQFDKLCDGVIDCGSFSDEVLCPGKFYCESGEPLYVDKLSIMDGVADCNDSSDEWPISRGHYTISSRYNLIGNWILQVLVWIMAVTALVGNIVVIISTSIELVRTNRVATASAIMQKPKKSIKEAVTGGMVRTISGLSVPRFAGGSNRFRFSSGIGGRRRLVKTWNAVLVLNLSAADFLVGLYLMWLAVMSASYSGRRSLEQQYWTFEREWRTSNTCNMLGTILVVSSQTSIYTLVALTSLRLYTVLKPFSSYHLKFRHLFGVCACTWLFSICLAVVPILPMAREHFITHAWVSLPQFHPPNINKTVADNLVRGIAFLTNRTIMENEQEYIGELTWSKMVEFMKVVAPSHSDWKFYGYYSEDGVCMPKLFVNPKTDKFWWHAAVLLSLNLVAVVYIALSYLLIYYKSAVLRNLTKTKTEEYDKNDNKLSVDSEKKLSKRHNSKSWERKSVVTHREGKPRLKVGDSLRKKYQNSRRNRNRRENHKTRQPKNSSSEMQRRIALLIATDCLCWIPICVMGFMSMNGATIPDTAYAITAIGLLPINSALNPLVYSRFMRTMWSRGWSSLRSRASTSFLSSSFVSDSPPNEKANSLQRPKSNAMSGKTLVPEEIHCTEKNDEDSINKSLND